MSDRDSSSSTSQTEGELDEEMESEEGKNENERGGSPVPSLSSFSASLRAVVRIKQKYQAMKKRRQEMALGLGGIGALAGAPLHSSPKIFTFDGLPPSSFSSISLITQKKKKRRRRRVLFPNRGCCRTVPKQERSRATYCLYLLLAIVFVQVKKWMITLRFLLILLHLWQTWDVFTETTLTTGGQSSQKLYMKFLKADQITPNNSFLTIRMSPCSCLSIYSSTSMAVLMFDCVVNLWIMMMFIIDYLEGSNCTITPSVCMLFLYPAAL